MVKSFFRQIRALLTVIATVWCFQGYASLSNPTIGPGSIQQELISENLENFLLKVNPGVEFPDDIPGNKGNEKRSYQKEKEGSDNSPALSSGDVSSRVQLFFAGTHVDLPDTGTEPVSIPFYILFHSWKLFLA